MITIKVAGKPLYIPKDTTLVLEQHNNSFDIDNITSDIIWTFDIPAKPNAATLDFAHYINISNHKLYRCEVSFQGIVIAEGNLYVQSVQDEKTISCGIALDGLGEDFGNRLLKENDYGDDVVISQPTATLEQHRANWLQFLYGSLNANSIYKFFLFTSEQFYKNNEAYGYHLNQWSTLQDEHDEDHLWAKYINRLVTYVRQGVEIILNQADTIQQGVKLFNTLGNVSDKLNGYAFAPAIRLDWLVRKVFANAGYSVTGDFLINDHIKKLYLQSMNAMDGDLSQFGLDEFLYLTGGAKGIDVTNPPENSLDVGVNEISYTGFKHGGTVTTFNFALKADLDSLTHNPVSGSQLFSYEDEAYFLWVTLPTADTDAFPKVRCAADSNATIKDFRYGQWPTFANLRAAAGHAGYGSWGGSASPSIKLRFEDNGVFCGIDNLGYEVFDADYFYGTEINQTLIQLSATHDNAANYPDPSQVVDIYGDFTATKFFNRWKMSGSNYVVRLVKAKISACKHTAWDDDWNDAQEAMAIPYTSSTSIIAPVFIPGNAQWEWIVYEETIEKTDLANTNTMMNIFDTMLRWKQHVPNVTNGDFIKKICRFFGLSMYIDPFHREVQLSFVNHVFDAGGVDITEYITNSERMTYEPKQYDVIAQTVLGQKGTAEDFLLDDITTRSELEAARSKKRMSIFIKNENAYNIATEDEKTKKFLWETNSGNDKKMTTGDAGDDTEEVTMDIAVPNMRVVDIDGAQKYLCDIATNGNTKLMDDDYTGEFDMILQQYKGRRFLNLKPGGMTYPCYIEDANPTCYDKNGNVSDNYLTLAATGKNSVGEKWLRKFYEFKAGQESYRFTARIPVHVFWYIYQMQLPQTAIGTAERRWLIIKNRRYLPLKVSYEIGVNAFITATIECVRQHVE